MQFLTLILNKYVVAFIAGILVIAGAYFIGHHDATIRCQNNQLIAQIKEDKKLAKHYKKIDSKLPDNKHDAIIWLYKYAR